jgi:glycosyltransferase involved in cell wall biosynthesis
MHLMFINPQPVPQNSRGEYGIDPKVLSGVRAYAERWKGRMTLAAPAASTATEVPDLVWIDPGLEDFEVLIDVALPGSVIANRPDVALLLHRFDAAYQTLLRSDVPVVLTTEFSLGIRVDIMDSITTGLLSRVRSRLGLYRRELAMRSMARRTQGLQCNGFAAWNAYSQFNPRSIFFHDHRMTCGDVEAARARPAWDGQRPLHLGFSGRLTKIKGPQYFVDLAKRLLTTHPNIRLHIMGGGELESHLRQEAPSNVVFDGRLDFESEWKSHVRTNIDLMVLPHVQGDPSCTYFESLGCGVPILGFANATLSPLVSQHGVGWTVPRGDVSALAHAIESIVNNPADLAAARTNGLNFMAAHDYESTVDLRVAHLAMVASASNQQR